MSEDYQRLLDSTIDHLQSLKARGTRFLSIETDTLALLQNVAPTRVAAPAPARPVAPERIFSAETPIIAPAAPVIVEIPIGPILSREEKEVAMAELRAKAMVCEKCPHLARTRKNVVFGVGDIHSPLMFVGEAPGADEDAQGEPFVGAAGQLLTKMIVAMGFTRDSVYIANILKCRPDTPGQTYGNRKPTPEEMNTCLPYVQTQIDIIKPKAIVGLGATAIEGFFGKGAGITRMRGKFLTYRGIPFMPTFHPAYLLRNQANTEKRKVWEDLLQVMETLGVTISDKQRGYFLKS